MALPPELATDNYETVSLTLVEGRDVVRTREGSALFVKVRTPSETHHTERSARPAPRWGETLDLARHTIGSPRGRVAIALVERGQVFDSILGDAVLDLDGLDGDSDRWIALERKKGAGSLHVVVHFGGLGTLKKRYAIGKEIGRGAYAGVYEGTEKTSGSKVAIKIVDKRNQKPSLRAQFDREIEAMRKLRHPNIVQLHFEHSSEDFAYIVMDYVPGGELYTHIEKKGKLCEAEAAVIMKQLLSAVAHMHERGIAHRDLKPENVLLTDTNNFRVKVVDFGFSVDYEISDMKSCVGSPMYTAPEMLYGNIYTNACDIWALGVILYIMLSGNMPFCGETQAELDRNILSGYFDFGGDCWKRVSTQAKALITRMLLVTPSVRPTAAQCLADSWFSTWSVRPLAPIGLRRPSVP
eukprot:m51a1_g13826 putative myosin light chain (410) ;mRNA; r:448701-450478